MDVPRFVHNLGTKTLTQAKPELSVGFKIPAWTRPKPEQAQSKFRLLVGSAMQIQFWPNPSCIIIKAL